MIELSGHCSGRRIIDASFGTSSAGNPAHLGNGDKLPRGQDSDRDAPEPDGLIPAVFDRSRSSEQQCKNSRRAEDRKPMLEALHSYGATTTLRPFEPQKFGLRSRTYSDSVGKTVLIMNSLNLSFSSVFGKCAERSNQTSCFRGAFSVSKYFAESTEGTS